MTKVFDPSHSAIVAAAEALDREGHFYKWWGGLPRYKDQDSISKSEFEDIVYRILKAAHEAEAGSS